MARPCSAVSAPRSTLVSAAAALMRARAWTSAGSSGLAADREVLDGPLGLRPPQGVRRDPHLAHGVVLDAEVGHDLEGTRARCSQYCSARPCRSTSYAVASAFPNTSRRAWCRASSRAADQIDARRRPGSQRPADEREEARGRTARRWRRGPGSRGRCRRRAGRGRTPPGRPPRSRRGRRPPRPRPGGRRAGPGRAGPSRRAATRPARARSRRRPRGVRAGPRGRSPA